MQPNAGRGFQVQVFEPEVGDFLDARAGVVEKEYEDAIPQGVRPLGGKSIKQRGDVVPFQKMRFWWGHAFDRDRGDLLTDDKLIGQAARHVLKQDDEHGSAVIPRARVIVTVGLQRLEKAQHPIERQVFDGEPGKRASSVVSDEQQKESDGIPIGLDGRGAEAFLHGQVIEEERLNKWAEQ
jgi:hypothetical protein